MKREELKEMGLTDEQIESVMAKSGAEVAALNTQITTLQSEKSQLENDKKIITKEKEDKEKAIADLQKNSISKDEYDKKIKEIEDNAKKENEDYIYNDLLNKGLDDAKVLKDKFTREAVVSLINKDKELGEEIKSWFIESSENYIKTESIPAAVKYGGYNEYFHNVGIVYATNPYYLVILSANGNGKSESMIKEISLKVQELHELFYSNRQEYCTFEVYN